VREALEEPTRGQVEPGRLGGRGGGS
jgi:hypothetical protein